MTATAFIQPRIQDLKTHWRPDLIAGLSVAVVAIPQSLAYASLAGLPPHLGLYAAFLPTIIAALTGTSKFLVTGPVAMVSLLTLSTLSPLAEANSIEFILLAATLAVLVGAIQIAMGIFKLGNLINYVAHTVILGFTNAAAILIALSQLPKLFGLATTSGHHPGQNLIEIVINYQHIVISSFFLGLLPLLFLILMRRLNPRFPSVLIVVIYGILFSSFINYPGPIVGDIPAGLPRLSLPVIDLDLFKILGLSALVISIVSYMEGISVAKSLAAKSGDTIRPNRELIAQGLANITSSFSGAYPIAGSFSRTALNFTAGAKSYMAAIYSGITILLVLLFFTPLFHNLPQATLAAIIVAAVINLINVREAAHLLKVRRREGVVAIATFVATIVFAPHLDYGIMFGIILSVVMYMHRSAHPRVQVFNLKPGKKDYGEIHFNTYPNNHKIMAIAIDWSLSFANASYIEDVIINSLNHKKSIKYVIILGQNINHIDHSAEEVLKHLTQRLNSRDITLLFTGIKPHVKEKLKHTHFFEFTDPDNVYQYANKALQHINIEEKKTLKKSQKQTNKPK